MIRKRGDTVTKLPKYFIMQVWEEIDNSIKFPNILEYFVGEDRNSLIQMVYNDNYNNNEIQDVLRNSRKRRNQTKRRWVSSSLKEYKERSNKKSKDLVQEYYYLVDYLNTFGLVQFQELFKKETPDEIMEEKIEILKKWSEDTNSFLTNYPYLKNKTINQIEKAIIADITVIIGDTIMTKYDGIIQDMIVEKPYSYVDNPIFSNNRGKLSLSDDVIEDDNNIYHYSDYSPSNDYKLRVLVSKEYAQDKQVRLLDNTDENIFSQVMKQRSNMFATQRKIFVNIGNIVKNLFNSDGIDNYKMVESRLYKMLNIRFNAFYKDGSIGFGIFDFVKVDYNNGWTAEITVNEQIYQEYLNKQTIRMYKDIMQRFELPMSKSLIFALQKERFSCYSDKQSYKQVYDYSFFTHKLRFKSRSKKENYKLIESSLEEIRKNGVGIKTFYREGDKFYIEYYPVTEYEMEDLIHSSPHNEEILDFATPAALFEPSTG